MALQHRVEKNGTGVDVAYTKVSYIGPADNSMLAYVRTTYGSALLRSDNIGIVETVVGCAPDDGDEDKVRCIYNHLKTLPDFAGATDV